MPGFCTPAAILTQRMVYPTAVHVEKHTQHYCTCDLDMPLKSRMLNFIDKIQTAALVLDSRRHRVDRAKLEQLFEYCALPDVGKVATFGHQYAFARAPAWYRRQQRQERFLSEPTEEVTKAEAGESVVTVVAEVQEALSTASSTDGSGSSSAQLRPAAAVLQAADAQA